MSKKFTDKASDVSAEEQGYEVIGVVVMGHDGKEHTLYDGDFVKVHHAKHRLALGYMSLTVHSGDGYGWSWEPHDGGGALGPWTEEDS